MVRGNGEKTVPRIIVLQDIVYLPLLPKYNSQMAPSNVSIFPEGTPLSEQIKGGPHRGRGGVSRLQG